MHSEKSPEGARIVQSVHQESVTIRCPRGGGARFNQTSLEGFENYLQRRMSHRQGKEGPTVLFEVFAL